MTTTSETPAQTELDALEDGIQDAIEILTELLKNAQDALDNSTGPGFITATRIRAYGGTLEEYATRAAVLRTQIAEGR